MAAVDTEALTHLRALTGVADAQFRPGQLDAIRSVVEGRRRALVVQRTGWGKSAVYLIATRLLRDLGAGPTVIVSPLLALMRNQLQMTGRLGLAAHTVNSTNSEEWEAIFADIGAHRLDLLLISPERLNNPVFLHDVGPHLFGSIGLLVIDEVHCISDWGHDFRPDYRRIRDIAAALPPRTPVLGTTATANDRVVSDVREQLGDDLDVYRGTLERESLSLHVLDIPSKPERLAWLAENLPRLPGSGIVYCLTIHDAEAVGEWLTSLGVHAATYTGPTPHDRRLEIEQALSEGDLDVVVATSALAMGYDNPRIEFVVHYQTPGSPIAYYQQVGRAGRAVETSYGILLTGWEDRDIQDWFIETAFPSEPDTDRVLAGLEEVPGLRVRELEEIVNVRRSRLESMLKILEVERVVHREGSRWYRSPHSWSYPSARLDAVTAHRRVEQRAMTTYVATTGCLMEFLRRQLDDPGAGPCGRCANCAGPRFDRAVDAGLVDQALGQMRSRPLLIEPRRQLPCPLDIGVDLKANRHEVGRSMSRWGEAGVGDIVEKALYVERSVPESLVEAAYTLLGLWSPAPFPTWLTWVPTTKGDMLADFAHALAERLSIPAVGALERTRSAPPQHDMANSCQQARNVAGAFAAVDVRSGPVLLVDDLVDSRWTLTVVATQLRAAGSGPVFPLAWAETSTS